VKIQRDTVTALGGILTATNGTGFAAEFPSVAVEVHHHWQDVCICVGRRINWETPADPVAAINLHINKAGWVLAIANSLKGSRADFTIRHCPFNSEGIVCTTPPPAPFREAFEAQGAATEDHNDPGYYSAFLKDLHVALEVSDSGNVVFTASRTKDAPPLITALLLEQWSLEIYKGLAADTEHDGEAYDSVRWQPGGQ
jgi:hypothetical protein